MEGLTERVTSEQKPEGGGRATRISGEAHGKQQRDVHVQRPGGNNVAELFKQQGAQRDSNTVRRDVGDEVGEERGADTGTRRDLLAFPLN